MLTDDELKKLFEDIESDRVERKKTEADGKKIRDAICAFANDMPGHGKPGVVFVGVNDDGTCANKDINDKMLTTLSDMRSDGNILPLPLLTVQKRTINGCTVAVVEVSPSDYPPVRYDGRIRIRVGPRRAVASDQEEELLNERRRARHLPWDMQPIKPATLKDLHLDLFKAEYLPSAIASDILEKNGRTVEQQLRTMRFLGEDNATPTVAGILAFGKSPADFLPGAYIQFLRIEGTELSDPISDQKDLQGPLSRIISEMDVLLRANIRIATDITSQSTETRTPDYPLGALQQLARNAIMHRNYESSNAPVRIYWFTDRIEIHNPGGPYGTVTVENFGRPGVTDYRNPTVAEVMKTLGYVQRFGVGIATARRELEENGNPNLEIIADPNHIAVVLRKKS
jgi:ATP-dependent DNA helicase RecG